MIRKLIFIVIIIAAAAYAAYRFGLFNEDTENVIKQTIDKGGEAVEKVKESIESKKSKE